MCLLLTSCAIKRDEYDVPSVPLPDQFKHADVMAGVTNNISVKDTVQTYPALQVETLLNEWWYFLENEELNHLIDQAMANNNDLRIAMLRIAQSHARAEQAFADQFPVLSAIGQGHHDSPSNGINSFSGFGSKQDRQYAQIGPRADWRVDIWGELKSLAEATEMEAWGATYQRDDTRRQLIANVIGRYVEYLSLNDRIRVANETKAALESLLEAVSERLKAGDATIIELEQQRAAVMAVEATIPGLELQRENAANALAQLLGVTPGTLQLSDQGIDSLNFLSIVPVVPSNLLIRRPDVRAVEARLLAADADIDVARARVLPPLDITAQAGWGILALGSVVNPYGPLFNVAANLSATIFDYGKRMQEVAYSRAFHEELVETYVRVVYQAVRETEDALANTHMNGKRLEAQKIATEAALRAWQSSQISYEFGDIDFLTLLDTERTYHRNLDEYHRVRMERFLGLVGVFAALGGGVPPGDVLPGDGKRPQGNMAMNASSTVLPVSGVVWDAVDDDEEFWLVQLAGLQDPAGVGHVWRDMHQRFPELMANRVLMPREEGSIENDKQERSRWYRIFVARFQNENEAGAFCRTLNTQMLRCEVVSSESSAFQCLSAEKPRKYTETESGIPASAPAATPIVDQQAVEVGQQSEVDQVSEIDLSSSTQEESDTFKEAYAVQLSTVYSLADAEQEKIRAETKGLSAYIYPLADADGRSVFTVRSGVYTDRQEAVSQVADLRNRLQINGMPVTIRLDKAGRPSPMIQSQSGIIQD